jgi:hypothetical protein
MGAAVLLETLQTLTPDRHGYADRCLGENGRRWSWGISVENRSIIHRQASGLTPVARIVQSPNQGIHHALHHSPTHLNPQQGNSALNNFLKSKAPGIKRF